MMSLSLGSAAATAPTIASPAMPDGAATLVAPAPADAAESKRAMPSSSRGVLWIKEVAERQL